MTWGALGLFALAILSFAIFGAIVTSAPVLAACSNTAPGANETVTCTGTETTPVASGATNVTVNVLPAASLAVGADAIAITLNDLSRVNNAGTISAGDSTAGLGAGGILFFADGNTVVNNGAITAGSAIAGQVFGINSFGIGANITNNNSIVVGDGSFPYAANATGIGVQTDSVVTNNGTIVGGSFSTGIFGCCGNVITNSAGALIQGGSTSFGIFIGGDGNTIANAGRIVVGGGVSTIFQSYGVLLSGNTSTATNTGTIQTGDMAVGMAIDDPLGGGGLLTGNSLINATGGVIKVGNGATGMASGSFFFAAPPNAVLTNNGTIITGDAISGTAPAIGIAAFGAANITNTGKIIVGNGDTGFFTPVYGILAFEDGAVIQNSGLISVGAVGRGIRAGGDNSSILNSGTILGGAGSTGIEVQPPTSGPAAAAGLAITNTSTGSIIVGPNSIGVNFEDSGTLINLGLIRATGLGSESIHTCGCSIAAVANYGTLDGQIFLGAGSSLTNGGLITVTDSDAVNPVGGFFHLVGDTYIQTPSGTLALRVTGDGRSDSILGASGTSSATLAGALLALVQPGLYANATTYLGVVNAGSINGQFNTVTTSSAFFTATATYNLQTVDLNLFRTPFGSVPGETRNERAIGNALESAYSQALTGNAATLYGNLLAASSVGVLDQLTGEGTAALQNAAFGLGSQLNNAVLNQLTIGEGSGTTSVIIPPPQYAPTAKPRGEEAFASVLKAPPAPATQTGRWRIWTIGFGGYRSFDGNTSPIGSANQTIRSYGGAVGFDYQVSPDLLVGFAAGGSEANVSVPDRATKGDLTGGHIGFYGLKTWGPAYAAASANYARFDNSTSRTITGVGPTEFAKGSFASDQISARLELGWKKAFASYNLTPFVAVEPALLHAHGYSESSTTLGGLPGILGLNFATRNITSLPTFVGLQADIRIVLQNGATVTPYARTSWVHEFEPNRQISAAFLSVPTASFVVDGARPSRDAARFDAGAKVSLDTTRALFANFSGEWSGTSQSYTASAGFKWVR